MACDLVDRASTLRLESEEVLAQEPLDHAATTRG
jgi:hypothetical protein